MKKYMIVMISIILAGCSAQSNTSNNEETTTTTTQIVTTTTSAESNYENIVVDDLLGTWHINEHQTITFYDDGTGLITDDGLGRLDFKAGEYPTTYEFSDDGEIFMLWAYHFECEINAMVFYKIFINDDGNLVFDDGYSPTDIVVYK